MAVDDILAYVFIKDAGQLSAQSVRTAFGSQFPGYPEKLDVRTTGVPGADLGIMLGAGVFGVYVEPTAMLPGRMMENAIGNAHWWPNAKSALDGVDVCLKVMLQNNQAGTLPAKQQMLYKRDMMMRLSLVLGALCRAMDCVAVMFPKGPTLNSDFHFVSTVGKIFSAEKPYQLWVGLHPKHENADNGDEMGCVSRGLAAFVGREISIDPVPDVSMETIFARAAGVVCYLLECGDVLSDGDTVGISASEKIRISVHDAPFADSAGEIRLLFDAKGAA